MNFDRGSEDVANILALEHVNLTTPDQSMATFFYVNGLGFTRDPYVDFGPYNVWINVGNQQFHLPTGEAQVLRGQIGVLVPDLTSLEQRLNQIKKRLSQTKFNFKVAKNHVAVTCPWGNKIRCEQSKINMQLGIQYVEFNVKQEHLAGIGRFYSDWLGAPSVIHKNVCEVSVGREQTLRFKATKRQPDYDGHHIAIYVANFSGPHKILKKHKLITEESDQHQYRFDKIVDPKTNKVLFELEHEVRSLRHPMFSRKLTNRNADQTFFNYVDGKDAYYPSN